MVNSPAEIQWQWAEFSELTALDIEAMFGLRQAVFVVEQDCPYQDADGKDSLAIHLLGWKENELVATLRVFPEYAEYDGNVSIGRVCTAQSERKNGTGKALMSEAIRYIQSQFSNKAIQIGAQSYLEKFYSGFGFEKISDEYLEDDIPHILMLRNAAHKK